MTKPIGYYTSYTPGDNSLLEQLQEQYGSTFEKITRREKLLLIESIASDVGKSLEELPRDEIYKVQELINTELSESDKLGLIETLIAQIRWGQSLTVSPGESPMQQ